MLEEPRKAIAEVPSDTAKAATETTETTTSTAVELPTAELPAVSVTSTAEAKTSAETEAEEAAICFGCGLGFKVPEFGFLRFGFGGWQWEMFPGKQMLNLADCVYHLKHMFIYYMYIYI